VKARRRSSTWSGATPASARLRRPRGADTVTCSYWGSYTEFQEVLALARSGSIRPTIRRYSLEQVNEALDSLERGQVQGRAVVTP